MQCYLVIAVKIKQHKSSIIQDRHYFCALTFNEISVYKIIKLHSNCIIDRFSYIVDTLSFDWPWCLVRWQFRSLCKWLMNYKHITNSLIANMTKSYISHTKEVDPNSRGFDLYLMNHIWIWDGGFKLY